MGWEGLGACKVPAPEAAMSLTSRLSDGGTDNENELDIYDYVNIDNKTTRVQHEDDGDKQWLCQKYLCLSHDLNQM